jgi:hypothetical protein
VVPTTFVAATTTSQGRRALLDRRFCRQVVSFVWIFFDVSEDSRCFARCRHSFTTLRLPDMHIASSRWIICHSCTSGVTNPSTCINSTRRSQIERSMQRNSRSGAKALCFPLTFSEMKSHTHTHTNSVLVGEAPCFSTLYAFHVFFFF